MCICANATRATRDSGHGFRKSTDVDNLVVVVLGAIGLGVLRNSSQRAANGLTATVAAAMVAAFSSGVGRLSVNNGQALEVNNSRVNTARLTQFESSLQKFSIIHMFESHTAS